MYPFDLPGPEFLGFYVFALAGGYGAARVLQEVLRGSGGPATPAELDLDPYQIAYLARGPSGAASAVLASMTDSGALSCRTSGVLVRSGVLPRASYSFEHKVYDALPAAISVREAKQIAEAQAQDTFPERLRDLGLLVPREAERRLLLGPIAVMGAVLVVGWLKVLIGIARERPVGFLLALLVVGMAAMVSLLKRNMRRTRRGDRVLLGQRIRHAALRELGKKASTAGGMRPTGDELILAVGLFAIPVAATEALQQLTPHLMPPVTTSSSTWGGGNWGWGGGGGGCASGGGGGCGGGGGGGGGGGCGGGGCGGCGGGG
jgi:uncharacterized protein (TIGR04222 family)